MDKATTVNILLVDDREDNLVALNAVLRSPEYRLVNASSGEQALELLGEREFAVVLMDVQMPGMDGLETARHIRSRDRSKSTPIILVTGMFPDEEHIRLGYEVGAVDFLAKPFDPRVMKSKVAVFVDLFRKTEKIRAQEKLLGDASESRFRTIFEQSPLAIQLFSPKGESVETNRAWERLWGESVSQARGADAFKDAVSQALAGMSSELPPVQHLGKWVESYVYPVRSDEGEIREVAVILKDVTDRKDVEEELRRSRDQLKVIFERVADGIVVQDVQGKVVYLNDVGAKLFGASADELSGRDFLETVSLFDVFDQDGNPVPSDRYPSRVTLRGAHRTSETVIRLRDRRTGRELWLVVSARSILNEAGEPHLIVSIYRDITEQRRTEENERFLADATAALASSLDYRSSIARVSQLAVPQLADCFLVMLPDERGVLRPFHVFARDSRLEEQMSALLARFALPGETAGGAAKVFKTGKSVMFNYLDDDMLRRMVSDDARVAAMMDTGVRSLIQAPLIARDRVLGVVGFYSQGDRRRYDTVDLALTEELGRRAGMAIENARLYAEAQFQRERLQEAVQARDEFISIASHELKTPVTSLILHAEMAALQLEREPLQELRERIQRFVSISGSQIDRLSRLIDEMLDVSRINNGKLTMEMETLDLSRLVRGVIEDFSEQLRETGTEAAFEGTPGILVRCDRYRIEQVVTNLLTNAMKYGGGKPILIRVGGLGGHARLEVRDRGIGIAPEHHERIFERFERAVPAGSVSGLGLGLYIVKKIMEAHGGTVSVESSLGKGSAFIMALPSVEREGE